MTPQKLLIDTAEHAFWAGQFLRGHRKDLGKPGEFLMGLSDEQREILKELKSDDLKDIRFDSVAFMV